MKSVHDRKEKVCNQGQNQFTAKENGRQQLQATLGVPEPSGGMDQSVESIQRKKYTSKRIKCDICDKRFNKRETFQKHMKQIHESTSQTEVPLQKMLRSRNTNKSESNALVSIN